MKLHGVLISYCTGVFVPYRQSQTSSFNHHPNPIWQQLEPPTTNKKGASTATMRDLPSARGKTLQSLESKLNTYMSKRKKTGAKKKPDDSNDKLTRPTVGHATIMLLENQSKRKKKQNNICNMEHSCKLAATHILTCGFSFQRACADHKTQFMAPIVSMSPPGSSTKKAASKVVGDDSSSDLDMEEEDDASAANEVTP